MELMRKGMTRGTRRWLQFFWPFWVWPWLRLVYHQRYNLLSFVQIPKFMNFKPLGMNQEYEILWLIVTSLVAIMFVLALFYAMYRLLRHFRYPSKYYDEKLWWYFTGPINYKNERDHIRRLFKTSTRYMKTSCKPEEMMTSLWNFI